MQSTTIRQTFLALMLASALPLAACDDSPPSPTQPGPAVSDGAIVNLTGFVANLDRNGPKDLDISFRIDDFTIVRATTGTPVTYGGQTFNTDAVRPGQQVTAEGRRAGGFLDATRITIVAQAP